MHARMHARTHACRHACTHARMHACTHACTHARMHARTHARMYVCMYSMYVTNIYIIIYIILLFQCNYTYFCICDYIIIRIYSIVYTCISFTVLANFLHHLTSCHQAAKSSNIRWCKANVLYGDLPCRPGWVLDIDRISQIYENLRCPAAQPRFNWTNWWLDAKDGPNLQSLVMEFLWHALKHLYFGWCEWHAIDCMVLRKIEKTSDTWRDDCDLCPCG